MSSLQFKASSPDSSDFQALINQLNRSLTQITQDSGESSFQAEEFSPQRDGALVGYDQDEPVACGSFRFHQQGICEVKRMFSAKPGSGSALLIALEDFARSKGYQRAILSTRRVNTQAVNFYLKNGYVEIPPYGKYVGREISICLGKSL
ncbi:putative Acyl-CoA N-acyltransferase [Vibrio nigripulchritudo SFn27]|uniref:Putative Acyl-CoA N-acyltransferase n=1 Tax=Vibrio nigripulchritudo TaxID=28173 RepID=U4KG06_9VIBR|nr:GNAT family N-acetyltransferase [Vibrio nigripulchritudo]CCN37572.1 putative Acyl-CoA N-acyltransferase [Vibrio nigripulchritudo AM115]CCN39566.1 putative Acyl-CoA N-acyltransferase [Vibrio nigripulchritudo FTn2]CCN66808.1 putative Acyl-CoA N-acyltransferase [Vibrio nigripulchritudo POn4]CCN75666.1 putative Acyl-CoA N-acyltransferase [Vibrio nigripulchritudo SO65]CCN82683.1 putative Acyl-CoA N-acyltransferase [Vibrio nigripulchritudo BLFn1]